MWFRCATVVLLAGVSSARAARAGAASRPSSKLRPVMKLESAPVDAGICGVEGVKQLSGYFKIEDDGAVDKEYFYWFFESQDDPSNDPVVLWLTGGPGCSSTLALLVENGPCSVDDDGEATVPNPYSWNKRANIIWVDQPAGVGFSYGKAPEDFDHDEDGVGEDMYWFLQSFFGEFSEYAANSFFVFGESYGGHYVPAVSHRIWLGNTQGEASYLNLKGLGVGNGMTSPEIQYPFYTEMALNNSYGVEVVTEEQAALMHAYTPACVDLIRGCQGVQEMCQTAQDFCNGFLYAPFVFSGLNQYDIRIPCGESELCYDFSNVEKFLRLESTRKALNVREESSEWQSCNMKVNGDFAGDFMKNFDGYVAPLLEDGLSVLIYAGDADFICNYLGNEAWTLNLEWAGAESFRAAPKKDWKPIDGQSPAGLSRSDGGFTFLQVYKAGHMVPMDQPEVSLAMLNDFIHGDSIPFEAAPSFPTFSELS